MWAAGCQPLIFPMTDPGAKGTLLVLASLPFFCCLPRGRQLEVSGGPDLGGFLAAIMLPAGPLLAGWATGSTAKVVGFLVLPCRVESLGQSTS